MGPEAIFAESKQEHRKMLGGRDKMGIVRGLEPLEEAKRMEGVGRRGGAEHAQGHVGGDGGEAEAVERALQVEVLLHDRRDVVHRREVGVLVARVVLGGEMGEGESGEADGLEEAASGGNAGGGGYHGCASGANGGTLRKTEVRPLCLSSLNRTLRLSSRSRSLRSVWFIRVGERKQGKVPEGRTRKGSKAGYTPTRKLTK